LYTIWDKRICDIQCFAQKSKLPNQLVFSILIRSAVAKSDFSSVETRFFPGSRHCAAVLQTQVPKLCTDLDLSLFYFLIFRSYSKFARKNNYLALGVYFPQPCSSSLPRLLSIPQTLVATRPKAMGQQIDRF